MLLLIFSKVLIFSNIQNISFNFSFFEIKSIKIFKESKKLYKNFIFIARFNILNFKILCIMYFFNIIMLSIIFTIFMFYRVF